MAELAALPQTTVGVSIGGAQFTDTNPSAASLVPVSSAGRTVTLTSAWLGRLPAETLAVSFIGPGGQQHHTEVGPALLEVLFAGGVFPTLDTWVAAVGSDNYVATVTPAEQFVGGRQLQLS